jgi:hypothetical protein
MIKKKKKKFKDGQIFVDFIDFMNRHTRQDR